MRRGVDRPRSRAGRRDIAAASSRSLLLALLALPLLTGPRLDGIARWIPAGPVTLHAGMLTLPALALLAAGDRARGPQVLLGAVLVSLLQPDAASALALASAAAGIARRGASAGSASSPSPALVAALAAALRGDLPPQPFVEHVIAEAARDRRGRRRRWSVALAVSFARSCAGPRVTGPNAARSPGRCSGSPPPRRRPTIPRR